MKTISEQVKELEEQGYEVKFYWGDDKPSKDTEREGWECLDGDGDWLDAASGYHFECGTLYRRKKEDEIKCPGCGGTVIIEDNGTFHAECSDCGISGAVRGEKKEAINSLMSLRKVVTCKDCKHNDIVKVCKFLKVMTDDKFYCENGEICTHRYVYPNSICIDCGRLIEGVTFIMSDQIQAEQETDK